MWDKHDCIRVILLPKDKKAFFLSSNFLEIVLIKKKKIPWNFVCD